MFVERITKGVEREEYLRIVGRIGMLDTTLAQVEELYRKYVHNDEEDDE